MRVKLFFQLLPLLIPVTGFGVNTAAGITDSEILLGQSAAFHGSSADLGSELWRGSQAYFDHINKKGGINGRKIKVVSIDDGYEGHRTLVNTIELVNQHKVFALYGYVGTPTIVKALPAIQKFSHQDLFLFSNFTGAQPQREAPHNKYVFNIRSSYRQETSGIVKNLVDVGFKRIAVFIQFDAYGRSGADGVKRALKKYNKKMVAESTYKRGIKFSESMKRQVDQIIRAKADAVVSIGSYAACAAFIRDARTAGFKGPIANVSFVGANSLLHLLRADQKNHPVNLTQNLINTQVVPLWDDKTIALVREYRKLMPKTVTRLPADLENERGNTRDQFSFVSLEGFLNAKVFVAVLKKAPKKLTRQNFYKTAESMGSIDVGLGHSLLFSPGDHQASDKVYYTTVRNGKYVKLLNWNRFK